jgi:RNA polymerase sigma-70 factor (ECF subfamily)
MIHDRKDELRLSFEAIVRQHREKILGVCMNIVGDRALAEDATQETFWAAYRALPRFRGDSSLSTWLYRIAIHASLRERSRRTRMEVTLPTVIDIAESRHDETMTARLDHSRVMRAAARLPAEQRTVLALFAVDGLTHAEIANILAIPEGTVWSRLHQARKRLRQTIEK